MSFWRPARDWRGARRHWTFGEAYRQIAMSPLSAKLIYTHIAFDPWLETPANDTDGKRW